MVKGTATTETPEAPQDGQGVELPTLMDDEAVRSLTVDQVHSLSLYQLVGLDTRHDLLNADQSKAVADAIQAGSRQVVKERRKQARQLERGENLEAWESYMDQIAPYILEAAETNMGKRVNRVAVCVERGVDGKLIPSTRLLKSEAFGEGEQPYQAPQDGADSESSENGAGSPESDESD